MLVVALILVAADRRRSWLGIALGAVCAVGLLWTFSRSSIVALAGGLIVLAIGLRRWWPVAAAVVVAVGGLAFASIYHDVAPRTHWYASDLPYQEAQAKVKGPLPRSSGLSGTASLGEPSIKSHWESLKAGIRTVAHHPQGYGLGNAGTTAQRFDVKIEAGESNYTEIGAETGLVGALLFIAWSLALLGTLLVRAWRRDCGPGHCGRRRGARRGARARDPDRRRRRALARVLPSGGLRARLSLCGASNSGANPIPRHRLAPWSRLAYGGNLEPTFIRHTETTTMSMTAPIRPLYQAQTYRDLLFIATAIPVAAAALGDHDRRLDVDRRPGDHAARSFRCCSATAAWSACSRAVTTALARVAAGCGDRPDDRFIRPEASGAARRPCSSTRTSGGSRATSCCG